MDGKLKAVFIVLSILCFSYRAYSQSCNITSKANDIVPDKLCAPVTVTWDVVYRGVSDGGTNNVALQFDWDDGSPVEIIPAFITDVATSEWSASHVHVYPMGGDKCNYHPTVTLVVNGIVCTSSMQEQIVTVWDVDNENGGIISIDPPVYPICVGNSGGVTFTDNSQWNCVPPDENDLPNNHKRWIQWVYGTNNGASNFIDNASVAGSVHIYPFAGSIDVTTEPILGPSAPWNQALPIFVPDNRAVGDEFEVTLNNWNYCNPYDQGYDPVTTTAVIVIVDNPDGSISPVAPLCENDASVFLNPATPGGQWSGTGIVDEWTGEFDPSLAGAGTHTINYYVEDGNNCSASGTIDIVVIDSPLANITAGTEVHLCPGTQLQLNGNPTQGLLPYVHQWTGDVSALDDANVYNPTFETVVEGNYNLVYRVTDGSGCFDEDTILIGVDSVSIHFLNKELVLCSGNSQVLEPNPIGGSGVFVDHQWLGDRLDLLSATDVEKPLFDASEPGEYQYEYVVRDSNGCEDRDSITVRIDEQPVSYAGDNNRACGLVYQLKAIESVGVGFWSLVSGTGGVSYSNVNDANAMVTVDAYGDYTFRWTETNNSCIDSAMVTISFVQIPQPHVINDADTCGLLYDIEVNQDVGIGYWKLITGVGDVSFVDELLPITTVDVSLPGKYTLAWVEDNNGCVAGDTVVIDFYPVPNAIVSPFDTEQCNPANVQFENMSTHADSYFWDFDDGFISNQINPVHSFSNNTLSPKDFDIELIATNTFGCVDTGRIGLRVLPTAIADFQYDEEPGCSPLELDFTNQSYGATSYAWDFGDGALSTLEHEEHMFINQEHYVQSFKVELVANNDFGCRDTVSKYVTVYPLVNYEFSATPQQGCHPLQVEMVADPGAYFYEWDFGDGQMFDGANVASHVFENTGTTPLEFNVKLHTNSIFGCRDSSQQIITVQPSPQSVFSLSAPEGCSPFVAHLDNQSLGAMKSSWYFGDGQEYVDNGSSSLEHTYLNSEMATVNYQAKLVVENTYGCKDSSTRYLSVFPKVIASISDGGAGCTPYLESILNNSIGASQFFWDFGDGNASTAFNGHHRYVNSTTEDQTYQVEMIAESPYGCSDTTQTEVLVYRRPQADFTVSPPVLQMPQSMVEISNKTLGENWGYHWQFGDGVTSSAKDPISHTYAMSGMYDMWLTVSGEHCSDSVVNTIQILPTLPLIDYGPDAEGCPPLNVQFFNNTIDGRTYFWDFGDGNVSSEKEPMHIYYTPGTYRVKLAVDGPGGVAEANHVLVNVYDKPFADFELRPSVVKLPETVSFMNLSEGAISYFWQFGDGNSSNEHSLQYEYENAGVYDVVLQVANDKGCKDERVIRGAVTANEAGEISFPNAFTPNPTGSSDGRYTPGSSNNYVFYPFVHEGVVEYELRIYTRWGELIFESKDIQKGWDGYHHDKICPAGVYIWKVRCRFSNGSIKIKTGDVTLFR